MQLRTNRGMLKCLLLSLVTFSIYGLICMIHVGQDVNTIASPHDGKKTMNYFLMLILAPFTIGILAIVWMHKICARMGSEIDRRGIMASFGAKDFWLWGVLGSLIVVGPFIFYHKFFKTINMLAEDYNTTGN